LTGAAPAEVVPGRLYVLGGVVKLDGRISWAPAQDAYAAVNCYLLVDNGNALLVDTGAAAHAELTVGQIEHVIPRGARVSLVLTRAEYECIGGLALISDAFEIEQMYTGGIANPFDAFDDVGRFAQTWAGRINVGAPIGREVPGRIAALDAFSHLEVISAGMRTLATYWIYHPPTRTMFTSDSFFHCVLPSPDAPRVVTDQTGDDASEETVRNHLLAKFFWLRQADTSHIRTVVTRIFDEHDVEVIAPTHGPVLKGTATVRRHVGLFDAAMASLHHPAAALR
jgi:hypothetical protein